MSGASRLIPAAVAAAGTAYSSYQASKAQQRASMDTGAASAAAQRRALLAYRNRRGLESGFDTALISRNRTGITQETQLGHPTLIGAGG